MSVRTQIYYPDGIYFITFTCARWLPLFQITNGYSAVYKWFDYLKYQGHYIIGYVIMPNHIHAIIGFANTSKSINSIVGNGKRFMAYELIKLLKEQKQNDLLHQLEQMVNDTEKKRNKKHEVFEPSFDRKECRTIEFTKQKLDYIHMNPCRYETIKARLPEEYLHSSAKYYYTNEQGIYAVTSYMEMQDIDLSLRR